MAVSRSNGCAYCVAHHSDALARYEKDGAKIAAVQKGDWGALGERDAALCVYAEKLTKSPAAMKEDDVAALRAARRRTSFCLKSASRSKAIPLCVTPRRPVTLCTGRALNSDEGNSEFGQFFSEKEHFTSFGATFDF